MRQQPTWHRGAPIGKCVCFGIILFNAGSHPLGAITHATKLLMVILQKGPV